MCSGGLGRAMLVKVDAGAGDHNFQRLTSVFQEAGVSRRVDFSRRSEDGCVQAAVGRGRHVPAAPKGEPASFLQARAGGRCVSIGPAGRVELHRMVGRATAMDTTTWVGGKGLREPEFQAAYLHTGVPSDVDHIRREQAQQQTEQLLVALKTSDAFALLICDLRGDAIEEKSCWMVQPPVESDDVAESRADRIRAVALVDNQVVLLWSSGHVYVIGAERLKLAWALQPARSPEPRSTLFEAAQVLPLSASPGYFAILFEGRVSFWDVRYGMGYGLIDAASSIFPARSSGAEKSAMMYTFQEKLVLHCDGTEYASTPELPELSLASAMEARAVLRVPILVHSSWLPRASFGSIPNMKSALAMAADASTLERFDATVLDAQEKEEEAVRRLASADLTPTAASIEEVLDLPERNISRKSKSRSWKRSKLLRKMILTEKVATTAVVRCYTEMHRGKREFLEPMVDILETGCLSATALQKAYDRMRDLDKSGPSLILNERTAEAYPAFVESFMRNVIDVAETDVVRIVAHAIAKRRRAPNDNANTNMLCTAIAAPFEPKRLRAALRLLPLRDVYELLQFLEERILLAFFLESSKSVRDSASEAVQDSASEAVQDSASKAARSSSGKAARPSSQKATPKNSSFNGGTVSWNHGVPSSPSEGALGSTANGGALDSVANGVLESPPTAVHHPPPAARPDPSPLPQRARTRTKGAGDPVGESSEGQPDSEARRQNLYKSYFCPPVSRMGMEKVSGNYIEWASSLLEAHVASLILDPNTTVAVACTLQSVQQIRAFCKSMEATGGILQHMISKKDLPAPARPMFSVESLRLD